MCWDRIVEVESSERKRTKQPEPAQPKVAKRPATQEVVLAPRTQDIPELVETS